MFLVSLVSVGKVIGIFVSEITLILFTSISLLLTDYLIYLTRRSHHYNTIIHSPGFLQQLDVSCSYQLSEGHSNQGVIRYNPNDIFSEIKTTCM